MDSIEGKQLLVEYNMRLDKEGIGNKNAFIVLRTEAGFALSHCGEEARFIKTDELKAENSIAYNIFTNQYKVNAVIYACPRFCALAAERGITIPPILDDMAQIVGTEAVVCDESEEHKILRVLRKNNACLLKSAGKSGALTVGTTPDHAFAAMLILEKSIQAFIEGEYIGGTKPLNRALACLMHMVYNRSYANVDGKSESQTASDIPRVIPDEELELRKEIIRYGIKINEENLVQSTWGNISVRLDKQFMLVTPTGMAYTRLQPYDIVRVDTQTLAYEGHQKPTSEKSFHAALLNTYPDINCVIHSHPVNCSVFAAAKKSLPITSPEDAMLLGKEAAVAAAAIPGTKRLAKAVVDAVRNSRSCIMSSHGMLVCGKNLSESFEKCRAMEHAAREYLDSKQSSLS